MADNCYACDRRIKKFKDEEKGKKLAEKKAKEDAMRLAAEELEKVGGKVCCLKSHFPPLCAGGLRFCERWESDVTIYHYIIY